MDPSPFRLAPFSRRRAPSLAGGAGALAVATSARRIGAQVTPIVSPVAAPVTAGTPVAFLAKDMGVANGGRMPFVLDVEGRVVWVSAGLRLVPRVDADA